VFGLCHAVQGDLAKWLAALPYARGRGFNSRSRLHAVQCTEVNFKFLFFLSPDTVNCTVPTVVNAAASVTGEITESGTVLYTCNTGYRFLPGTRDITCLGTLGWSATPAQCEMSKFGVSGGVRFKNSRVEYGSHVFIMWSICLINCACRVGVSPERRRVL
jgi:hypothetical protein